MQVRAVVELAVLRVRFEVRHQLRQLHRLNMVQAKFLKAWRVNECCTARGVDPIQRCAGGGVLARIKSPRDLCRQHLGCRYEQVGQTAFARA